MAQEESRQVNETLFKCLSSCDPAPNKQAIDAIAAYTRAKIKYDTDMREVLLNRLKLLQQELQGSTQ